jgi:hypothetical protein
VMFKIERILFDPELAFFLLPFFYERKIVNGALR